MSPDKDKKSFEQEQLFKDNNTSEEKIKSIIKEAKKKDSDVRDFDKPEKTIRIAVSGDIVLTKLETDIINTTAFQRLRKYRQLGTSYLVYPSANHTRFEHSLGVLKKTEEMITHIENNFHSKEHEKKITHRQKRVVRLASLLHDIANIPFGHTLEDETNVIESYQEDKERNMAYLGPKTEIGSILKSNLTDRDYQLLLKVICAKKDPAPPKQKEKDITYISELFENAFIVDLIKNTVCSDLLDYLERDAFFCNLPLTVPNRFLRYLYLHKTNRQKRIAIRLWKETDPNPRTALISELIQLLETRYFLAERVYFHHAKQISSAMVASAVWHAMHQEKGSLTKARLLELGDDELISELKDSTRFPLASKLAKNLGKRQLYKRFYSISRELINANKRTDHLHSLKTNYHENAKKRNDVELSLCNLAGLDPGDVIIYCPNPEMNLKIAEMNVTSRRGGIEPLYQTEDKLSKSKIDSILESHRNLWALQVFVRPKAINSQEKSDLLNIWCRAFFEESDGEAKDSTIRYAVHSTTDDILRKNSKILPVSAIDEIVQEAIMAKKEGTIDRKYLNTLINKRQQ